MYVKSRVPIDDERGKRKEERGEEDKMGLGLKE
jgi:hypothetical protein